MRNPETAKRLKEAMDGKGLTAKELSDKSGVNEASISQYLHGIYAPKNQTAMKLATVLDVNPMWLTGFDVPKEPWDAYLKEYKTMEAQIDDAQIHFSMEMEKICATLNEEGRKRLMEYASDLLEMKKYTKDGD